MEHLQGEDGVHYGTVGHVDEKHGDKVHRDKDIHVAHTQKFTFHERSSTYRLCAVDEKVGRC